MSQEMADAIEAIADYRMLTSSAVVREILQERLTHVGLLRPKQPNGHHQQQVAE